MKLKIGAFLIITVFCLSSTAQQNSVLSNGDWFKIAVENDGIYKLDYSDLDQMGFNLNDISINSIKIFGGADGMLPNLNSLNNFDDLFSKSR